MTNIFGKILLLGSGETSHAGGQAFEEFIKGCGPQLRIRILETPAGFELNSPKVAGKVGDFLKIRLQNYQPDIKLVAARAHEGEFSTNSPELCKQLSDADLIFMGAGSPTYTVRQLRGSCIWLTTMAAFAQGANLALASAATIALGKLALPVYEIYKVGADPFWNLGLNFLSVFGLDVSFIPHWNNNDGGAELDTSRCFMGRERFETLTAELPKPHSFLGLDEQTGLILDFENWKGKVIGKGKVHLWVETEVAQFGDREEFSLEILGRFALPDFTTIPEDVMAAVEQARTLRNSTKNLQVIPENIVALIKVRQKAREALDWKTSDQIRQQIYELGWRVLDTPDGAMVEPNP
jgi:hypothetical protein